MNLITRLLQFDNQLRLPRQYLLFYSRTPNNWLDVGWEGDFGWDSDLSAWSIPRTVTDWTGTERDMFTILGVGLFFDAAGNSLVVTGAQILALAGINQYHILFSLTKGLVVYDHYVVTDSVLVKAYKYFGYNYISGVPATGLLLKADTPPINGVINDSSGNGNDIAVFSYCGRFGGGTNFSFTPHVFTTDFRIEVDVSRYVTVAALRVLMAGLSGGSNAVYINNGKIGIGHAGSIKYSAGVFVFDGTIAISRVGSIWTISDGSRSENLSWSNSNTNFTIDKIGYTSSSAPVDISAVRFYSNGVLTTRWVVENYIMSPTQYVYDDVSGGIATLYKGTLGNGTKIDFYIGERLGSYLLENGFEADGNIAIPKLLSLPTQSVTGGAITNQPGQIKGSPIFLNFPVSILDNDPNDILFDSSNNPRDITPPDLAGWVSGYTEGKFFYSVEKGIILIYDVEQTGPTLLKIQSYLKNPYIGDDLLFYKSPGSTDFFDSSTVAANYMHWQASAFSSVNYTTEATTIRIVCNNNFYTVFPTLTVIGLYVDGVCHSSFTPTENGSSTSEEITLAPGTKTISIVNGPQSRALVTEYATGSWVVGVSANKKLTIITPSSAGRILIYGDSISVGQAASPVMEKAWVMQVRAAAYPVPVAAEAWGWRSLYFDASDSAKRAVLVSTLASYSPAKIWLAIGTNDYGLNYWTAANFGAAYASLLDDLHTALPSAVIYCQTPLLRTDETANGLGSTLGDYRTQISNAVSTRGAFCTLVDGTAIMTTASLSDGIHPNTLGHTLYADYVKPVLGIA